ncbi:malate dehydrogenase-like isoform X2 [Leptidea sinapis]|uniref:malate dehydrogenase-like isoform X2 n=1 Tax=Leptidea sinapis TaxID=189913 RepID=UPI0021C3D7B8|nr:malate dehydrogenase-like isoform X2 [Leptidea sinapis]
MFSSFNILQPCRAAVIQSVGHKNNVMSEVLATLEKQCDKFCFIPRIPPRKVAVIGAGTDVGRIASLMLKQQKIIKILSLYDDLPSNNVLGVASDIAHIDTSPEVVAYQGRMFLKTALHPPGCYINDRDLFFCNMSYVRTVSLACAEFCPQAVIAVQTPPVDCNYALCAHTLKLAGVYDKRKVLGVNAINAMRANQLFCSITGSDPSKSNIPVVCGTGHCTRVPVFSAAKAGNIPQSQVECLTRLVRDADDIICKVKSNWEQGHLSLGFASARFVVNLMLGLFERPTFIDSALVEQGDPKKCYNMEVCATPVTVGSHGVAEYAIPSLNPFESALLEDSKCDLEDMVNLGRCSAIGDDYYIHPDKLCSKIICEPCPVCAPQIKKKAQ